MIAKQDFLEKIADRKNCPYKNGAFEEIAQMIIPKDKITPEMKEHFISQYTSKLVSDAQEALELLIKSEFLNEIVENVKIENNEAEEL